MFCALCTKTDKTNFVNRPAFTCKCGTPVYKDVCALPIQLCYNEKKAHGTLEVTCFFWAYFMTERQCNAVLGQERAHQVAGRQHTEEAPSWIALQLICAQSQ